MLTGFALVSAPLLLAVVIGAAKVRHLSAESAALVRTGVEATHYSQQLFQEIASLERGTRLYQVLNDPSLLEVYRDSRERLLVTLTNIEDVADDPVRQTHVQALRGGLRMIDAALMSITPPSP
jgi:two-component system sensor histidine kinase GlrK